MRKKKILFHSNYSRAFTGFGKNAQNVLRYLYNTDKYDIVEAATGIIDTDPNLSKMPWKTVGTVPSDPEIQSAWRSDPQRNRAMSYGSATIDKIIKEEQPDIYVGAEDIWAFGGYWDKKWWDKINHMIWTTLDSLPILPEAVTAAPKIKNYFVWASFAETALHELNHTHVKTLRGSIETAHFYRLDDEQKTALRKTHNLSDEFIIGYVFRNQLRKSVPNLLDGFKLFLENNPDSGAKLLLHTHWGEGWDIPRLLKEKSLDPGLILTTHRCDKCHAYDIKPFSGQNKDCRFCGGKQCQNTPHAGNGVEEKQLNEIYNLMDVYCHPFTSGGQEIPIQEAKLTELITLVTNYSCGEDLCTDASYGLPLDWAEYREPGTQFIKASTYKESIADQLQKVYEMDQDSRRDMGKGARQFVIDNFSIEIIGKKLEEIFDSMENIEWDFDFTEDPRNPEYSPPPIESDSEWLTDIYKNILCMEVGKDNPGHQHWMSALSTGQSREQILHFFRDTAHKENLNLNGKGKDVFEDLIDDPNEKRLAMVMPGTVGDVYITTALLPSIQKVYPEYAVYFITKPQYFDILNGNPYVYKTLPYDEKCDNLLYLEGNGETPGFFDIAFLPHIGTQKIFNYQHNAQDRIQLDLCT